MEQIIETEKKKLFQVMKSQVGKLRTIGFCSETERYAFIPSLTKCIVVPMLHLNTSRMIGSMEKDSDYLAYRIFGDKMVALTRLKLITWCLLSGKVLYTEDAPKLANMSQY